jgi:hypothetical protein
VGESLEAWSLVSEVSWNDIGWMHVWHPHPPITPLPHYPIIPSFHFSKIKIAEKINSIFEFFFKKWDNIYFQNEEKQV